MSDRKINETINKFIDDIENIKKDNTENNLEKNALDPLDILFSNIMDKTQTLEEWEQKEKLRQINKKLLNKIGEFHELIGQSFEGWIKPESNNLGSGLDLINKQEKIAFEIKNKWNTLNSDSLKTVYKKCADFLKRNPKWEVYLIHVIPKNGGIDNLFRLPNHT